MKLRRHGMTLIELLVVIAIIGVLAGLLLPAILQARSGGRKAQCAANLKQLAQAVQTFHHRNERLPPYWGAMQGRGGDRFGGWLLHLLPDLEQQAIFDSTPVTSATSTVVYQTVTTTTTGRMLPAIPPSPDFVEGTWQFVQVGTGVVNGVANSPIYEWQLVGRVGTPGLPERPERVTTYSNPITVPCPGVAQTLPDVVRNTNLPFLMDLDDPGQLRNPDIAGASVNLKNVQLTNYQANAHVFTKFGSRWTSGSNAGLFPSAPVQPAPTISGTWYHGIAFKAGPLGRSFTNVTDGVSNTILVGEGMRQCDNLAQYRAAFFPSYNLMNEHGFGIECTWRQENGSPVNSTQTYGNTLMFQTMPDLKMTNPLRLQSLHGPYLMVAMCDGSVRAISSFVSRREPVAANACGRENFGSKFYEASSRGGNGSDGIWDMLMVPADPPGNVLANDGTIGREK